MQAALTGLADKTERDERFQPLGSPGLISLNEQLHACQQSEKLPGIALPRGPTKT